MRNIIPNKKDYEMGSISVRDTDHSHPACLPFLLLFAMMGCIGSSELRNNQCRHSGCTISENRARRARR